MLEVPREGERSLKRLSRYAGRVPQAEGRGSVIVIVGVEDGVANNSSQPTGLLK